MTNQSKISVQLLPLSLERTTDYLKWFNDSEINKYLLPNTPKTKGKITNWINETVKDKSCLYFSIFLPKQKFFIGHIGLKEIDLSKKQAEIGIVIGEKKYWRRGIGTKAFSQLIDRIKNLKIENIFAKIDKNNIQSIEFFTKLGFEPTVIKEAGPVILVYRL